MNNANNVEQQENKTPIVKATSTTATTTAEVAFVDSAKLNRHNLESFAGLLGVALPQKTERKAKADKRFLYGSAELGTLGMALEDAANIGTAKLHKVDEVHATDELLTMTLLQYFKRTSTTIKRTVVDDKAFFQVVKRPEMTVTATADFSADAWDEQYAYLTEQALQIALSIGFIADAEGNEYLLAIGKKKPIIVRLQQYAATA